VDVIVCGGAPVALSRGTGGDAELAELLRRETGLPVVTANGVVVEALRFFGARSVVAAAAAMVWGALRAIKIMDCQSGYGRLMDSLRARTANQAETAR